MHPFVFMGRIELFSHSQLYKSVHRILQRFYLELLSIGLLCFLNMYQCTASDSEGQDLRAVFSGLIALVWPDFLLSLF